MNSRLLFLGVFALLGWGIWGYNAYKLTECDFESNYKCEVIHGVGVIVPHSAIIAVWFDTDK